jgi:hypothetical protein
MTKTLLSGFRAELTQRNTHSKAALGRLIVNVFSSRLSLVPTTLSNSSTTLERLASACDKPPDVIFADYGYASDAAIDALYRKYQQGHEITESDLKGKVLTAADLIRTVRTLVEGSRRRGQLVDARQKKQLRNFLANDAKLYVYSYTSQEFIAIFGSVEARVNRVNAELQKPKDKIEGRDTRHEFFNNDEFDGAGTSKYDPGFYAHLVGGLINNLIQREFFEHMLRDAKRLKYIRTGRTVSSVAVVVLLAGAVGASSEYLGSIIARMVESGTVVPAIIMAWLTVVFIFAVGLAVPFLFEWATLRLFAKHRQKLEVSNEED